MSELEVEDPRQKKVKLGPLKMGQKGEKQVVLVAFVHPDAQHR